MHEDSSTLYESDLRGLGLQSRGKVRDIYALGPDLLLLVATDRISAFDVVLPDLIPGKGEVLTALSRFWFQRTAHIVPGHLYDKRPLRELLPIDCELTRTEARAMAVRRFSVLPVEAIVRGYLAGSGWKSYQREGAVCGITLPPGLRCAQKLPEPLYTPSTKAPPGEHDENIDFAQSVERIGRALAEQVRDVSLQLYREAADYALGRGIIIADTKFEFGLDEHGKLHLIDELLTPDSSRFWPADQYREGANPPSFDKQFVRDYLESIDWDQRPPTPTLPRSVIEQTSQRYRAAWQQLVPSSSDYRCAERAAGATDESPGN